MTARGALPLATRERLVVVALLATAALARVPTLGQPLLEAHSFRQTQTAYTALLFARDGIDLLHPRVPVLGPPYVVAFELPLFQALAVLPMRLGLPPDVALRLTGLACFCAAALVLWALVRRLAGADAAIATLAAFLFSPLALLWGRTAMIDYLAVAAALAYLLTGIAWREGGPRWLWLVALLAGTVAMAVKLQSTAFWIVPLVAYRASRRSTRDPWLLSLALIPLGVALAWTLYAETLRVASPGTAWMTTSAVVSFFGSGLADHLSIVAWVRIAWFLLAWVAGPLLIGLLLRALPAIRGSARPWFWASVVASPLLSIAAFPSVWSIHDYYAIAATPSVAVAMGLGAAWLSRGARVRLVPFVLVAGLAATLVYVARLLSPALVVAIGSLAVVVAAIAWLLRGQRVRLARGALLLAGAGLLVGDVAVTADYWGQAYASIDASHAVLSRSAELDAFSAPDEDVLMAGNDWSPAVLYYARRQGQMLPAPLLTPRFVGGLPAMGYRTFFSWDPASDAIWPASSWPWVGALAPHTFALGEARTELRGAGAASSDDVAAFAAAAAAGRSLIDGPVSLRCGAVNELPAGTRETWVRLAPADREARVTIASPGTGALPARSVLVISSELASGGTLRLGCAGTDALTVLATVESR